MLVLVLVCRQLVLVDVLQQRYGAVAGKPASVPIAVDGRYTRRRLAVSIQPKPTAVTSNYQRRQKMVTVMRDLGEINQVFWPENTTYAGNTSCTLLY